ncbi:MAG: hypothetical protein WCI72_04615 [archaeon]
MKIRRVLGVLCCFIAAFIAFSHINVTVNVIGYSFIEGIKGIVVVVFFLAGLGMMMSSVFNEMQGEDPVLRRKVTSIDAEALRNAKQGVPEGEYHARISNGMFNPPERTQAGGVNVPSGTFRANVVNGIFNGKNFGVYRDKRGNYRLVLINSYEGDQVCKVIGKDKVEHTDERNDKTTAYHAHVEVYSPENIDFSASEGRYKIHKDSFYVDLETLKNRGHKVNGSFVYDQDLPEGLLSLLSKVDNEELVSRAQEVFYNPNISRQTHPWYRVDRKLYNSPNKKNVERYSEKLKTMLAKTYTENKKAKRYRG